MYDGPQLRKSGRVRSSQGPGVSRQRFPQEGEQGLAFAGVTAVDHSTAEGGRASCTCTLYQGPVRRCRLAVKFDTSVAELPHCQRGEHAVPGGQPDDPQSTLLPGSTRNPST